MNRLLITFFSVLTIVVATEQKPFKHEKNILAVLNEYMSSVDNKDIDAMLNHLTIPIDLHFGSGRVVTVRSDNELRIYFRIGKIRRGQIFTQQCSERSLSRKQV